MEFNLPLTKNVEGLMKVQHAKIPKQKAKQHIYCNFFLYVESLEGRLQINTWKKKKEKL